MMNDVMIRMLQLSQKGYGCSQILIRLFLEARGEDNPALVRSMAGLAYGCGGGRATCGTLTGACCALALYAGKGQDDETGSERLLLMLQELTDWFEEQVGRPHGGIACETIVGVGRPGGRPSALRRDRGGYLRQGAGDPGRQRLRSLRRLIGHETMEPDTTESLCPVCLNRIGAERVACGEQVQLVKTCPEHGEFRTVIWNGRPSLREWQRPKTPVLLRPVHQETLRGCPFDCGLCREHRQRSCTVLLEVTRRCNLHCAVCFAGSHPEDAVDPGLEEIRGWYQRALSMAPGSNIQLSGGEPTVRDDLPEIVAAGREIGFGFIQLNTNGIRLANDTGYVKALKDAGLASVFLQFDGTDDAVHLKLRGRALADVKRRAIDACAAPRRRGRAGAHAGPRGEYPPDRDPAAAWPSACPRPCGACTSSPSAISGATRSR